MDIKIDKTKTDIYRKDTHIGQYVHFTSFEPWYRKTAWVKSLVEGAERICRNKHLFEKQILKIKSFMSWNGYPIYVCKSVLKRPRERKKNLTERTSILEEEIPKIWLRVPYIGPIGEEIAKRCISKLHKYCKNDIKVVLLFDTKKVALFCSDKDPVPKHLRAHAIYQFECPGCKASYVGKTDRCLVERTFRLRTSAVGKHLLGCEHFHHIVNLHNISVHSELEPSFIETHYHISTAISENTKIIDRNNN